MNFCNVLLVGASEDCHRLRYCLNHPTTQYSLAEAATESAALSHCQSSQPEAILISHQPPAIDGLTVLRALGQQGSQPLPALILVNPGDETTISRAIEAGAQAYLNWEELTPAALHWAIEAVRAKTQLACQGTPSAHHDIAQHQRIEAALRRSEARNQAMLLALPDLIMRMTVDGRYLDFFSGGDLKTVPLPNPTTSDNTVFDALTDEEAHKRLKYLRLAVETQSRQIYEQTMIIEGEPHCEEVRVVPCGEDEALVVVRDMTERKQAEEALRRSEAKNRAMLQALPDLIMRMTVEGRYLDFFSGGGVRFIPLPNPIVSENMAADGLPEDIARQRLHYLQQALETGKLQVYEQTIVLDGEERREEVRIVPCGEDESMVIVRDITERKQAELELFNLNQELEQRVTARTRELAESNHLLLLEIHQREEIEAALRESRQFIESIADRSPNILYIYDLSASRYVYINRAIQDLLGYPPESILSMGASFFQSYIHPDDVGRLSAYLKQIRNLGEGEIAQIEYRIRLADGSWRWFQSHDTVFKRDSKGKVLQFVGTARDVTQRQLAEAALQKSEGTKRALIDAIPDLLVRVDRNGTYLDIFRSAGVHLVNLEKLMPGANIFDVLPPDLAQSRLNCVRQVLDTGVSRTQEYQIVINGQTVHEEARLTLCEDDTVLVMVRDISARRLAEETVRRNQARFQRIAANAPGAMYQFVLHSDGRREFPYMSDRITEILEIDAAVIQQEADTALRLLHPDDQDSLSQTIQASAATLTRWIWEGRFYTPSGRLVWVQGMSEPELREDGSILWDGLFLDITQRKQVEAEIERSQKLRDAIFNNSTDALFLVDAETFLTIDCNDRAVELFEADCKADLIGIVGGEALQKHLFSDSELEAIVEQMSQKGFWSREVEYITLKGNEFWGNLAARTIPVEGQVINLVRVTDITDRKRSEQEMHRALAREKELSDLKSRVISMTSHEFRTPLAVIASSAGILKSFGSRLSEEKKQQHLQTIQTYVQHTTHLLDDILLLNRAEADRLAFIPTTFSLVPFCQTLTQELQLSSDHHSLQFSVYSSAGTSQPPSDMPVVCMDQKLLRQILINLLVNAIKYSPEGSPVHFSLYLKEGQARFVVQDWGLGIPAADIELLFESFYRASNVGTIQGTGLGLSVVKKCVDLHHGTVQLSSELGVGTTFTVTLPSYCQS
ncbi:PAS domain S-box protein [Pseudanabaena sp. FACHB-2040]|uniref:PAS domain S-box protein n=1 Tax=Pseudanabaena sp. FACHB-2040 TaxID=2692859 RepID=UPI00168784C1|nr:PAS domain S-box protein [Pseudanabaena sp. FACHB-2040]MBD2257649.1 PAS domain S-box protein [Pseudanabaena sp. FACHB-2040]